MKKPLKLIVVFMTISILISMTGICTFAEMEKFVCVPELEATDDWYMASNVSVELKEDNGFEMQSIDGSAWYAYVTWSFTIGQLKQTPYFNIGILNTGHPEEGVYMRMFFDCTSEYVQVVNPHFVNPDLENWVRANSKTGKHSFNLLDTFKDNIPGDDEIVLFTLYVDPFGWDEESLQVEGIYLSSEEVPTVIATPTASEEASATPATSEEASATPATSEEASATPIVSETESTSSTTSETESSSSTTSENEDDDEGSDSTVVILLGVLLAIIIVVGLIVLGRSKKSKT